MRTFFQEFKEFAVKGNMIDIAIGVIIGTAFNKVIDVLVKSILMPPLSLMTDGFNWQEGEWILREPVAASDTSATITKVAIQYGKFIETMVDFLIIGLTVFVVVKAMNRLKNRSQDAKDQSIQTPKDIELLNKMADLLESQNALLAEKNKTSKD
ncbi:MAG: large conductance mechanosensitive channel protein MscL [Flavobacteriales bacterium]|nr:large conductance mechanosensitive channel protein MscL [Flavobacteriales bacterium]